MVISSDMWKTMNRLVYISHDRLYTVALLSCVRCFKSCNSYCLADSVFQNGQHSIFLADVSNQSNLSTRPSRSVCALFSVIPMKREAAHPVALSNCNSGILCKASKFAALQLNVIDSEHSCMICVGHLN